MINISLLSQDIIRKHIDHFPDIAYAKEFFSFQKEKYGLQSSYLGIFDEDDLICIIPINYSNQGVFSVYNNYTTPYFIVNCPIAIDWAEVVQQIKKQFRRDFLELGFYFVNSDDQNNSLKLSPTSCFIFKVGEQESRETIFRKFNKKTRNEIRKAEKYNFIVKISGEEELNAIYDLYLENMRRHGAPPKSKDYFIKLFDCFKDKCRAIMVYDEDKLIGANLVLFNNKYLRLVSNLSSARYWDRCINNFLYYKMIEWGYEQGARVFDYGSNLRNDKSHSHLKIGFGAQEFPVFRIQQGSKKILLQKWLKQKRFNLKIKFHKLSRFK